MAHISPVITTLALVVVTSGCTPDVYNSYDIDVFVESQEDTAEDTDVDSDTDVEEPVNLPDILTIDFSWSYGWPFTVQLTPFETDVNFGDFVLGNTGDEPITVSEFPVLFVGDNDGSGFFMTSDWRTFFENCRLRGHEEVYAGPVDQIGARIPFTEPFTVNPGEFTFAGGVVCDLNGGPYDYPIEFAIDVPIEAEIIHDGDGVDIGNRNGYGGIASEPGNRVILPVPEPEVCEPNATDVTMWFNGPGDSAHVIAGEDYQMLLEFCIEATQDTTLKGLAVMIYGDDDGNQQPFDRVQDAPGAAWNDGDGLLGLYGPNLGGFRMIKWPDPTVLMGFQDLQGQTTAGNDAVQSVVFTDDVTLEANEPLCMTLTADVAAAENLAIWTKFGASLDVSTMIFEDCNGDIIPSSAIIPSSDIVGFAVEVRSP